MYSHKQKRDQIFSDLNLKYYLICIYDFFFVVFAFGGVLISVSIPSAFNHHRYRHTQKPTVWIKALDMTSFSALAFVEPTNIFNVRAAASTKVLETGMVGVVPNKLILHLPL